MPIENIPEVYLNANEQSPELFVYDFKMTNDVVKSKVNLSMNMFSFLLVGKKQVHFVDNVVSVNKEQSLIIKKGNCLWTELLDNDDVYYCKLLFFSEKKLTTFLKKHSTIDQNRIEEDPYFIFENDSFIISYLNSLTSISQTNQYFKNKILSVKFEEIMLYLLNKYGEKFELYLHSLISKETSSFNKVIESNVYSNLKLEEIAFLCNMSLSTFKRYFTSEYKVTPGKWLQDKRLQRAKETLQEGIFKPSDINLDYGYNNLSNFSVAFKNKFGVSPKDVIK